LATTTKGPKSKSASNRQRRDGGTDRLIHDVCGCVLVEGIIDEDQPPPEKDQRVHAEVWDADHSEAGELEEGHARILRARLISLGQIPGQMAEF
jgi:hypothetical protein